MKYTSLQSLGSVLCAAFVLVACASSDDSEPGPTEEGDSGAHPLVQDSGSNTLVDTGTYQNVYDSGSSTVVDSSEPKDTAVAPTGCTGHCTQNSDCAAICTPPSGDVACCDTATNMCFVASGECTQTTSPSGGEDASAPY